MQQRPRLYFAWRQLLQWKEHTERAARLLNMQAGLRKVEESIPVLVQQAKELSMGKGSNEIAEDEAA